MGAAGGRGAHGDNMWAAPLNGGLLVGGLTTCGSVGIVWAGVGKTNAVVTS